MELEDKVAIVTGAANGIGRAISQRLAEDGIIIAAVDIVPAEETIKLITETGGRASYYLADVSKPDEVTSAVEKVVAELGPVTILVNNAGLHPSPPTNIVDMSFDVWRRMMSVDLDSMFLFCKAVAPMMMEAKWGRIINFSSTAVDCIIPPGGAHYVAAKAGVIGLTRGLATEMGDYFVTVNAIAPGTTNTPGATGVYAENPEALLDASREAQTIKKTIQPKHIAAGVAYLVSDDAELVTGQVLHIDAGTTRT